MLAVAALSALCQIRSFPFSDMLYTSTRRTWINSRQISWTTNNPTLSFYDTAGNVALSFVQSLKISNLDVGFDLRNGQPRCHARRHLLQLLVLLDPRCQRPTRSLSASARELLSLLLLLSMPSSSSPPTLAPSPPPPSPSSFSSCSAFSMSSARARRKRPSP